MEGRRERRSTLSHSLALSSAPDSVEGSSGSVQRQLLYVSNGRIFRAKRGERGSVDGEVSRRVTVYTTSRDDDRRNLRWSGGDIGLEVILAGARVKFDSSGSRGHRFVLVERGRVRAAGSFLLSCHFLHLLLKHLAALCFFLETLSLVANSLVAKPVVHLVEGQTAQRGEHHLFLVARVWVVHCHGE